MKYTFKKKHLFLNAGWEGTNGALVYSVTLKRTSICQQKFSLYSQASKQFLMGLDGCSSFQILLNFSCIFPIESFCLLVEFSIPFINVVNICIIIIRTSPALFVSFFNLFFQIQDHPVNFLCGRHMCPMKGNHCSLSGEQKYSTRQAALHLAQRYLKTREQ